MGATLRELVPKNGSYVSRYEGVETRSKLGLGVSKSKFSAQDQVNPHIEVFRLYFLVQNGILRLQVVCRIGSLVESAGGGYSEV